MFLGDLPTPDQGHELLLWWLTYSFAPEGQYLKFSWQQYSLGRINQLVIYVALVDFFIIW